MGIDRYFIFGGGKYRVIETVIENGETKAVKCDVSGSQVLFAARPEYGDKMKKGSFFQVDDPGAYLFHVKHFQTGSAGRKSNRRKISDQILTSKEAQEVLGIKSSRLSKHVVAGEIKQIKRGIFLKDDVAALYDYRQKNLS